MRTIIRLDDELHRRAKAYAARRGLTLTALIEEALRIRLQTAPAGRLPTFRGGGLQPGLSLDRLGTVLDRMDGVR
jgi:hypothetical protein